MSTNKTELKELLLEEESEYLDFKYDMYDIFASNNNKKVQERTELLRDIISLVNIKRMDIEIDESYLIIGVDETNEKYNGKHKNINFIKNQTVIQLAQEYIEPSLIIEFKDFYLSGDRDNILISNKYDQNYDRILILILKRQKGIVYEFKKEIGNRYKGFERIGASYTRDGSHKRRIKESERRQIREYTVVDLNVKFIENPINKKFKTIYEEKILDNKLSYVKKGLVSDFNKFNSNQNLDEITFIADVDYYITKLKDYIIRRNRYFKELNKIIYFGIRIKNESELILKEDDFFLGCGHKECEFIEKKPIFEEKPPNRNNCFNKINALHDIIRSTMPNLENLLVAPYVQTDSKNYYIHDNKKILEIHFDKLKQKFSYEISNIIIKIPNLDDISKLRIPLYITIGDPYKTITKYLDLSISYQ